MSEPKPRHRKDKCSSQIRTVVEVEVAAVEDEAIEEPSEEGGASKPNKVGK
jgi:hypothetical protein